ncbi:hypothetical protein [Clostridium manihotivorum]|uniref:Uncharacterized protein n=1 Tax=Clostridium manihotivorum TaxID=2320868 RepID=A0A410DXK9_9CLOT|nr:hypothetical protein [Clostridium manihotivorum]QAA33771.1 hypothetical protein C1I91_20245 [Clostridium manihotivorum]
MDLLKRLMQFLLCTIGSLIFFEGWMYLLSRSNNEPFSTNVPVLIGISLGMGWALFQVVFVRYHGIREQGRIAFLDLIILSTQSTLITIIVMLILMFAEKGFDII